MNDRLDDIAVQVTQYLQRSGAKALPIPASQLLDMKNWASYISHKAVALAAGLGWQGKSLLVVSPECGPRMRLVTVLTDAALEPDKPLKNRCGKCTACTEACPARAIKGVNTAYHYADREEALYFSRCVEKVVGDFAKKAVYRETHLRRMHQGLPWGARKGRKSRRSLAAETRPIEGFRFFAPILDANCAIRPHCRACRRDRRPCRSKEWRAGTPAATRGRSKRRAVLSIRPPLRMRPRSGSDTAFMKRSTKH